jgi:hypothetical protein
LSPNLASREKAFKTYNGHEDQNRNALKQAARKFRAAFCAIRRANVASPVATWPGSFCQTEYIFLLHAD